MDLPAVFAKDGSRFQNASPARSGEQQAPVIGALSVDAGVAQLQAHDRIHLVAKVRRLFSAYLAANPFRRADFRRAVAYLSYQFEIDPPTTPTLEDDVAAAVAVAQKAADAACANDIGEFILDRESLSFVDSALLADASATLALGYRYVVGFYATDPTLSDLGEAAVGLALSAEREHAAALSMIGLHGVRSLATRDAFASDQKPSSNSSTFERPAAKQNKELVASLGAISQRLKEQILLMA